MQALQTSCQVCGWQTFVPASCSSIISVLSPHPLLTRTTSIIPLTGLTPLTTPLATITMSQSPPAASSSPALQTIFVASLKEYEKKTKKDLLTHPLLVQLQTCNSPTEILTILRAQAQQFEQSTSGDDKLTKWLNPTVNVLYAFSSVIGTGVGLVNSIQAIIRRFSL